MSKSQYKLKVSFFHLQYSKCFNVENSRPVQLAWLWPWSLLPALYFFAHQKKKGSKIILINMKIFSIHLSSRWLLVSEDTTGKRGTDCRQGEYLEDQVVVMEGGGQWQLQQGGVEDRLNQQRGDLLVNLGRIVEADLEKKHLLGRWLRSTWEGRRIMSMWWSTYQFTQGGLYTSKPSSWLES